MRWMARFVAAVVLCLALPSQAFACYLAKFLTYNAIPGAMNYEGGLALAPGDELGMVFSGGVNLPVGGGKGVVTPTLGYCKEGSFGALIFGAAAAWQIWKDASGNASANFQSGLSYVSSDGTSDMVIPLGASYAKKMSEMMSWFAAATLLVDMYKSSSDFGDFSETETDPAIYGGIVKKAGSMTLTGSLAAKFGYDTDLAVTVLVSTTGSANAIRRLGSTVFRR
jgi:hypothetical protein